MYRTYHRIKLQKRADAGIQLLMFVLLLLSFGFRMPVYGFIAMALCQVCSSIYWSLYLKRGLKHYKPGRRIRFIFRLALALYLFLFLLVYSDEAFLGAAILILSCTGPFLALRYFLVTVMEVPFYNRLANVWR